MGAPRKYSDEYRETLVALVTEDGLSVAEACRRIAAGHAELEPLNLNEKTAGDWVKIAERDPRPDLEDMELPEILNTTARGLFDLVNTDIHRMKRQKGQNDPEALLTLARTLKELQPLTLQASRKGKGTDKPAALLDGLNSGATTRRATKQQASSPPRSLHAQPA